MFVSLDWCFLTECMRAGGGGGGSFFLYGSVVY